MAVKTLYGAPVKYIAHTQSADTIWTELTAAIARGDVTTVGSLPTKSGSD